MTQTLLAVLGTGLVDPTTLVIRADDPGVTRGDGCFEGIRVVRGPDGEARAVELDRHLARMTRSAGLLDIAFDEPAWRELVDLACVAWTGDEAALKLVLTRGADRPTGFLTITGLAADYPRQRRDGIRLIVLDRGYPADAFAAAPWLLGGVKTLSYAVNMAAQREAERRGVEDALFVAADGTVLEAPTGTVVWASGGTLFTTELGATGILAGTTQQLLFENARADGWQTRDVLAPLDELHAADAVWIVSSVRGPVEVVELDGKAREHAPEVHERIVRYAGF